MRLFLITFIVTSFHFFCNSQNVYGVLKDSSNATIPYAQILIKSINYSTVSNSEGYFQLFLNNGKYPIEFRSIGYETKVDTISVSDTVISLNVILNYSASSLEVVNVIGKSNRNLGREIIKNVMDKRKIFADSLSEYTCDTYCFGSLEKEKTDSLLRDSVIDKQKLNIIEWKAKTSFKAPQKFKDDFYAFMDYRDAQKERKQSEADMNWSLINGSDNSLIDQTIIQSNPYLFVQGIKDIHFSIFDNVIDAPRLTSGPIISPIAFNAFLHYDYKIENVYFDSLNQKIYQIHVEPLFKYEPLFKGTINIKDENWEVLSYDFEINPETLLFFKNIHLLCTYEKQGGRLVPVRREYFYQVRNNSKSIKGYIRVNQTDFKFKVDDKAKHFWEEAVVYQPEAFNTDSTYWKKNRPFKLKEYETRFMQDQDSAFNYHQSKEYLRYRDSMSNKINPLRLLVGGYFHNNSFKEFQIKTSPLKNSINFLDVGGLRIHPWVSYQKTFKNGKRFSIKPFVDYGTFNHDWRGSFGGSYMFNPLNFSEIEFDIGNTYEYINNTANIMSSIFPKNKINQKNFGVSYRKEVINGFYLKGGLNYSDKSSITNLKYPDEVKKYFPDSVSYLPMNFNGYKTALLSLNVEYYFKQRYMIRKNRKYVLGSPWPRLNLIYTKAIPNVFKSSADYDYLEMNVMQNIKLKTLGYTKWQITAGSFLNSRKLYSVDQRYFRHSNYFYLQDPINNLQMLDTTLKTKNSFVQFNIIHHFNGYFLNKIWLINKLKLEEVVIFNFLKIPNSNFYQSELLIGFERKVSIWGSLMKIGAFYSLKDKYQSTSLGSQFKIGFNFYNFFNDKWSY